MGIFHDIFHSIRKYSSFRPGELKASIITIIILAFTVSFGMRDPGKRIDILYGLTNLIAGLCFVTIIFFGRLYAQKATAASLGLVAEYEVWSIGLIIILILTFSLAEPGGSSG